MKILMKNMVSSVLFYASTLPGALGGFIFLLLEYQQPSTVSWMLDYEKHIFISLILVIVFGGICGLATIVVLTNTDRTDIPRMIVLSFIAGLSWPIVLPKIMSSMNGDGSPDYPSHSEPDPDDLARAKKVTPELREGFKLIAANNSTRETLANINDLSGQELETYIAQRDSSENFRQDLLLLDQQGLVANDGRDFFVTPRGEILLSYYDGRDSDRDQLQTVPLQDAMPGQLTLNTWEYGVFEEAANQWYTVNITQEGYYAFRTSGPSLDATDTRIELYQADATTLIGEDDDGDIDAWPYSLLIEYLFPGDYIVQIETLDAQAGQEYSLVVNTEQDSGFTFNSEVLTADKIVSQPLALDVSVNGLIDSGDALFLFEVASGAEGSYTFTTTGDEGGMDTYITLLRQRAVPTPADTQLMELFEIGKDDDGGEPRLYSSLTEYLTAGIYYLRVKSYWDEPGEFKVKVTREQP